MRIPVALLLAIAALSASSPDRDLEFVLDHNPVDVTQPAVEGMARRQSVARQDNAFTFQETSELKLAGMGAIRLYQIFISSQDMPTCNFTPSCSRYGMASIRRNGLIVGGLMTADRLLRCNGLNRDDYPTDPETGKSFDPPVLPGNGSRE